MNQPIPLNIGGVPELSPQLKEPKAEADIPTVSPPQYSHEQLRDALMFTEDVFERADIPFFLWGKTLEHVMSNEEELTGDAEISIAVKRAEWTKEHVSILEHWGGFLIKRSETLFELLAPNKIPVLIHIIEGQHRFLDYPETAFYWIETFKVPNPYSAYLVALAEGEIL